ncbi:hypothetical protein OIU79_007004 [Salix purpurea]|uniref:Uncharacterized protein n=1 Tax=Salix purpurea TaxID=77065 RepID=A0A9Q0TWR8_SALPP|nr:hypothetical protein OIU79_007004 [Salix purpurea]
MAHFQINAVTDSTLVGFGTLALMAFALSAVILGASNTNLFRTASP